MTRKRNAMSLHRFARRWLRINRAALERAWRKAARA